MEISPRCARCPFEMSQRLCKIENGKAPNGCPTQYKPHCIEQSLQAYQDAETCEFARQASLQESAGYGDRHLGYSRIHPIRSRIQETIEFAWRMNYRRLGLAFCVGLRNEAKIVEKLMADHGFDMISVVCKAGRVPKEAIGIREAEKVVPSTFESMCNPVLQAMILNDEKTQFNILLGLCVGHDSLFFKYSQAPCTVLAVKDRLLGHNPLAAVYTLDSYYRALK